MPLVAIWGSERVEAWRLDDDLWASVRATYREHGLVMACGEPGGPVERAGTRYFRHKAACGLHDGGPESPEHLATKALVADVARENGWDATVEAPAPDRSWIADVLVFRPGSRPVAIEVQWASQTPEEFASRTARYKQSGIDCVWLVGPKNADRGQCNIRGTADKLEMEMPDGFAQTSKFVPMREALASWFRCEIKARYEAVVDAVEVVTAMSKCHNERCGAWFSFWWLGGLQLQTRCGKVGTVSMGVRYPTWVADRPEVLFQDEVRAAISQSSLPPAAEYRSAYSQKSDVTYLAQHCPQCRWHLGDGFIVGKRRTWNSYAVAVRLTRVPLDLRVTALWHLCVDTGRGRCLAREVEGVSFPTQLNDSGGVVSLNSFSTHPGPIAASSLPRR